MEWATRAGQHEAVKALVGETVIENMDWKEQVSKLWKSRATYKPNWYDKRSGLNSSIVVAVTVGGKSKTW